MHPPSRPSGVLIACASARSRIEPVALDRQIAVPDRLVPARRFVDEFVQLRTGGRQLLRTPADDPGHVARPGAQQPRRRRVDLPHDLFAVHHDDPLDHVLQHLVGQPLHAVQLVVNVQVAPPLPDEEQRAQDEHRRDGQPRDHEPEQLPLEHRDLRVGRRSGVSQPGVDQGIVVE